MCCESLAKNTNTKLNDQSEDLCTALRTTKDFIIHIHTDNIILHTCRTKIYDCLSLFLSVFLLYCFIQDNSIVATVPYRLFFPISTSDQAPKINKADIGEPIFVDDPETGTAETDLTQSNEMLIY